MHVTIGQIMVYCRTSRSDDGVPCRDNSIGINQIRSGKMDFSLTLIQQGKGASDQMIAAPWCYIPDWKQRPLA